jgi:phage shock protein C
MNMQQKRLVRAKDGRMIAGVCKGFADYFGIDPTLVRIGFVLTLLPG